MLNNMLGTNILWGHGTYKCRAWGNIFIRNDNFVAFVTEA